jgi:hypothetical protein
VVVELVDLLRRQHRLQQGRLIQLLLGKVAEMEMDSPLPPLETRHLGVVAEEATARDSLVDPVVEDLTIKTLVGLEHQAKDLQVVGQLRGVWALVVVVPEKPETQTEQDLVVMAEHPQSPEQASFMQVEVLHSTR